MFRFSIPTVSSIVIGMTAASVLLFASACLADVDGTKVPSRDISPRGALTHEEQSVTALFKEASPSVVYITSIGLRRDFFSFRAMEIPQGTGSGFIWDDQGHIVTNFHVIQDARRAEVTLADQSSWPAERCWRSETRSASTRR